MSESSFNGYDLPPDDTPRFAFEVVEEQLDEFAIDQDAEFQRSWMKTRFMVTAYAYGDWYQPGMHPALALARAWEELQIAFTGRGEAFLSGAVLHLWNTLPNAKAEKRFEKLLRNAFAEAERATPDDAARLYLREYRDAPLRNPDDGFTLDPLLPVRGIRLREWALGEELDPDDIEEHFNWLELADRHGDQEREEDSRPVLTIVDGGRDE